MNEENKEEIINIIKLNPNRYSIIIKKSILYKIILEETLFLNRDVRIIERIYCILNDIKSPKICKNKKCNNKVKMKNMIKGYSLYCGIKCANKCEDRIKDIKENNIKKYGVNSPLQTPSIIKKREESNLKKYGTKHNFSSQKFKDDMKKNNLEKHGVEYFFQSKEYKISQNNLAYEYIKDKLLKFDILLNIKKEDYDGLVNGIYTDSKVGRYNDKIKFDLKCLKCNFLYKDHLLDNYIPYCEKCDKKINTSTIEIEINSFLNKNSISFERNNRKKIHPFEIDFLINNFGIEINGVYFHSYQFLNKAKVGKLAIDKYKEYNLPSSNKGKYFHFLKTEMAKKENIQLFHIYDLEWKDKRKREIIKSMILYKLNKIINKINARSCEMKIVSNKEKSIFLDENHLQGTCVSKTNIGLYYNNELVSLMTFGESRFENGKVELLRFANKKMTSIRGAASKLFTYFLKNYNIKGLNIVSFADRRYSDGGLYEFLNFDKIHVTKANYKYFKNNNLYNRMIFQKKFIKEYQEKNKYGIIFFDEILTERENMFKNNYKQIFDSGQIKYEFKI